MAYIVRGVNDDENFCECCGKQNIKKVVWIENTETQEIKHFGTTCAASPVKGFGVDKEIKKAIKDFESYDRWIKMMARVIYKQKTGIGKFEKITDMELYNICLNQAKADNKRTVKFTL